MNNTHKPTTVLIHGWGGNASSWQNIEKRLTQSGYVCLAIKLPGFDLPEPSQPWGVPEYAGFVLDSLQRMQIEPPYTLVGHSFGGRVSIYIASTKPDMVEKLILTDSAGVENRNTLKLILINILSNVFHIADSLPIINRFSRNLRKLLWRFTASPDYSKANQKKREILKKVVALNLESFLPKIDAKTLIIWGENDNVTPIRDAKILNRGIKNSKLILIKNAGHNAYFTHSQEWLGHVINFLKS